MSVLNECSEAGNGYVLCQLQELEIRSEMHVKIAKIDYPIRRAGTVGSSYRIGDLGHSACLIG